MPDTVLGAGAQWHRQARILVLVSYDPSVAEKQQELGVVGRCQERREGRSKEHGGPRRPLVSFWKETVSRQGLPLPWVVSQSLLLGSIRCSLPQVSLSQCLLRNAFPLAPGRFLSPISTQQKDHLLSPQAALLELW